MSNKTTYSFTMSKKFKEYLIKEKRLASHIKSMVAYLLIKELNPTVDFYDKDATEETVCVIFDWDKLKELKETEL